MSLDATRSSLQWGLHAQQSQTVALGHGKLVLKFHFSFFSEQEEGIKLHFNLINVLTLMLLTDLFVRKSLIPSTLKFCQEKEDLEERRCWQKPQAQPSPSSARGTLQITYIICVDL